MLMSEEKGKNFSRHIPITTEIITSSFRKGCLGRTSERQKFLGRFLTIQVYYKDLLEEMATASYFPNKLKFLLLGNTRKFEKIF